MRAVTDKIKNIFCHLYTIYTSNLRVCYIVVTKLTQAFGYNKVQKFSNINCSAGFFVYCTWVQDRSAVSCYYSRETVFPLVPLFRWVNELDEIEVAERRNVRY